MNRRIGELAKKAGFSTELSEAMATRHNTPTAFEKFAELIVQECADICESMQLIGPYKEVQDATLKDASVQIKEHFGVEK